MTLTPEATQALYANESGQTLTEQLTAAYQRNLAEGLVTPTDSVAAAGAAALAAARMAPESHEQQSALANLDPITVNLVEATHVNTTRLFERINIDTPGINEFVEAGVDFTKLGKAHEAMTKLGLEPQLVLAPVLDSSEWRSLFQELQDDSSVNHDGRIKDGGLWINDNVQNKWDALQGNQHTLEVSGQQWQVVVVPGTSKPNILNVDHRGQVDDGAYAVTLLQQVQQTQPPEQRHPNYTHPTIATYLTLQASRLQANEPPIDKNTSSWLDGEPSSLQAPGGSWRSDIGQVYLGWVGVDYRSDILGVRLPVWGE